MDIDDRIAGVLTYFNLTTDDVRWVGTSGPDGFRMTWAEFVQHAPRGVDYRRFDPALVVVGDTWWLAVDEYEAGWEYHRTPTPPRADRAFTFDLAGNIVAMGEQEG